MTYKLTPYENDLPLGPVDDVLHGSWQDAAVGWQKQLEVRTLHASYIGVAAVAMLLLVMALILYWIVGTVGELRGHLIRLSGEV